MNLIKKSIYEKGIQDEDIQEVDVYIKPEEETVFYVVNREINGQISF